MQQVQRFQVGDRVRSIRTSRRLPPDIQGTIERVFAVSDLYEVRFDDRSWRRVVHHSDLELIQGVAEMSDRHPS
jgi:hypothetical protein